MPLAEHVKTIFGESTLQQTGLQTEGVDDGGEPIKAFRPTGRPGLWLVLGPFANVRFFSKYLVRVIDASVRHTSDS